MVRPKATTVFWAWLSTSYNHEDFDSLHDVNKTLLDQLEQFFISYNKQRGKKFRVTGTGGPKKAVEFLKAGI